ncbi:4Fe-4S ferredoxin [Clostridium pasteurianum DSM 525 = ATCC 6013]|uniref:4Fe-4S ferredoxin n=1 Tax=Clostridium pasteurianum DSM 525 = ATCC 6013 TaxID=1262449 RepID=A0A0H3IZK1_CLOPA|nr:EFR1 family ferrodoxin [Clostridium pasteurianum]AJA46459.1 4Fe-4S ferredoxin [Clostridium pasteurianum DSM 525 = ATCC 6013]AJA50447.1 4Fe-4S ferredoxin [Clostridium pasteurianum DSM 525 = ATCC 6013]AOZ73890.1 4Fe-4S ferredoxin [Clostridium pasteurianum DSM 525 = ATCC 6013]AOZ77687.1 4Fe-4S ferredoxin [Clostridium pasteurianum]ELP61034.1 4Fe-4S ferredoxin [Clostridium pasteurianum DSM 525 = ATCC 6013]
MKILYFTATGNNLYLAKRIGNEYYSIPKLMKERQFEFEDEKIGIVFPVYFLGIPKIVEEFLNKAKLKSKYIFAVASYGGFSGAATRHLLEIGKRNGIEFSYINEILMVDNYLPMFDINKEMEKEPKKNIEENLQKIIWDIQFKREYINKHSIIRNSIRFLIKNLSKKSQFEKKFSIGDNCNSCKICEKVCPVDNIQVHNKPVFKDNCQQCLACINHCPQKAIRIKGEKSTARFINQNIRLREIIDANN